MKKLLIMTHCDYANQLCKHNFIALPDPTQCCAICFFFTAPDPWLYLSIETTLPARLSGTKKSDKWWNIVQLHKAPHNYFCQSSYSTCEGDMFSPHFTCLWASTIFLSQVSCKVSTEALQTVWPEGVAVDLATSEKLFHGVIFANPPILVQLKQHGATWKL